MPLLTFLTKQAISKTLHLHTQQSEPERVIGRLWGVVIKRRRSDEGGATDAAARGLTTTSAPQLEP